MEMIREELNEMFDGMEPVPMSLKKIDRWKITSQKGKIIFLFRKFWFSFSSY
jgi:hypothetical protein